MTQPCSRCGGDIGRGGVPTSFIFVILMKTVTKKPILCFLCWVAELYEEALEEKKMIPVQCVLIDSAPEILGPGQYVIRLVAPYDQRLLATIPVRVQEEGTLHVTHTRVTLKQGNAEQVLYE